MASERNELPGDPSPRLIRSVRFNLARYGIKPARRSRDWLLTWEWAAKIKDSYLGPDFAKTPFQRKRLRRAMWPSCREIATQYLVIILGRMMVEDDLKLPYRGAMHMPPEVRNLIVPTKARRLLALEPKLEDDPPELPAPPVQTVLTIEAKHAG